MQAHNLTTEELVRQGHNSECDVTRALAEAYEEQLEYHAEEQEALLVDLAEDIASNLEEQIEEYIDSNHRDPDCDMAGEYWYLISEGCHIADLKRVQDEVRHDAHYGRHADPLSEAAMEKFLALDMSGLRDLDYEINKDLEAALMIEKGHIYSSNAYSYYSVALGEHEEELEHWLEDVNDLLVPFVKEHLTGTKEGSYYYSNSDDSFVWTINMEWLEEHLVPTED